MCILCSVQNPGSHSTHMHDACAALVLCFVSTFAQDNTAGIKSQNRTWPDLLKVIHNMCAIWFSCKVSEQDPDLLR